MQTFLSILRGAAQAGASDVHIKPGAPVTFRLDRRLVDADTPAPEAAWIDAILPQIVPANLQARLAEEREVDFAYDAPGIGRFRVNVFHQRGASVLSLRLVKSQPRSFAELQLPPIIQRIAESPRGIVLLTGATGSGKSTTLAAMIEHLNGTVRRHIITLEDPIEYLFRDRQCVIEQREIGIDTGSFASGLKNVLRQDPDIIVIGEMRDPESVSAAITAANVGHLVIATLHTVDAAKSVQRTLEFFPGTERDSVRQQFSNTLHAVICQRLIPAVSGGVIPALEVLINTATIAKLIHAGHLEKIPGALELGVGDGMQSFDFALHELVHEGRISQEQAILHSPNPEALKMRFQGVILNETRRILSARG